MVNHLPGLHFSMRPPPGQRRMRVQVVMGLGIAAAAGGCAEGYSAFAVAQAGPLFILLSGIVLAAAIGGMFAGATCVGLGLVFVLMLPADFVPETNLRDRIFITAAFVIPALVAIYLWESTMRAYRQAEWARARADRLASELDGALRAKDEFLGLVSHEMRTPMTQILGYARALDRQPPTYSEDEVAYAVADIHQQSERLAEMLENMLILSRLERGATVEGEPVLVQRVAAMAVEAFREQHPDRGVTTDFTPDAPPILGQPGYVAQVLGNLLSNAHKYSPPEAPIHVVVRVDGPLVAMEVMDRGPGLKPQELDLIYEAYVRLPDTSASVPGAGLGLTVSRRLTESIGGTIAAQPRQGGGTTFTVSLPAILVTHE